MYKIAQMVLILWPAIVLLMFVLVPARRAVVIALVASWLFLPELHIPLPKMPDYTKSTATCLAILIGAITLDPSGRIFKFKPSWIDLPVLVWCFVPFFSSVSNQIGGTGLYDGMSVVVNHLVLYGGPWLIGRLYFTNPEEAKDLAVGILIGGLLYVPLCLFEVKMSPQLHQMFYGFSPYSDWLQAQRWGGWRPTVFLQHGLAVGVWMATATSMAFWCWLTRLQRQVYGVPMWLLFVVLFITTILVKSTGAIMIMLFIMGIMLSVKFLRTNVLISATVLAMVLFLGLRVTGVVDGTALTNVAAATFGPEKASSLTYRLLNENAVVAHTATRPIVGWGGWGRGLDVYVPDLGVYAVPDSMWILMYSRHGIIGLTALFGWLLIPAFVLFQRMKPREVLDKRYAAIPGLALVSLTYSIDGLFNAMINPVFIVSGGAVAALAISLKRRRVRAGGTSGATSGVSSGASGASATSGPQPLTTRPKPVEAGA